MSNRSVDSDFARFRHRYGCARARGTKTKIIDEVCEQFDFSRKWAIRKLGRKPYDKAARKRGPKPRYGSRAFLRALTNIWLASGQLCSKRLVAALALWLPFYDRHFEALDAEVRDLLLCVSPATVDRLLADVRVKARRGKFGAPGRKKLQGQIPVRLSNDDIDGPGWMEVDTVAHSGGSMRGEFVWTLTMTDLHTGWTENAAVWNKKSKQVARRMGEIEESRLPFALLGVDSDNGSEFINAPVYGYLRMRDMPVAFTRSRPYHKNDNAHVEQKQFTHVRQLLGYDRIDNPAALALLNDLYANETRLLTNGFQPSTKLLGKTRDGAKVRRHHETPRTPLARLLASGVISEQDKQELQTKFSTQDPFALRKSQEKKLRKIFRTMRPKQERAKTRQAPAKGCGNAAP